MAKGAYIGVNTIQTSLGSLEIGSIISLNIANTPWEFIVVHQGKPSSMYDDSCDGTWLLLKNAYTSLKFHNSYNNSYAESALHSYLNNEFLNMFDANIQSAIKSIKIPYHNGQGTSGSVVSGASGLSTKIFALSGYEVNFTTKTNSAFPIDGACLSYFSGTSLYDSKRIAYLNNGSAAAWWLRSPMLQYSEQVWCVHTDGGNTDGPSSGTKYIRPAMILPSNLAIKNGTIDGSMASTGEIARKVKKGYIGVPKLSDSLGDLDVGATVKLNVDGTATDFFVVQQGNPDGALYDASCDGTWLLMKDCYTLRPWSDAGEAQYQTSLIHEYLNSTFLNLFDETAKSAIKQVKIPYVQGHGSETVMSGENGLSARVFLLGAYELGWTSGTKSSYTSQMRADGACLDYFASAYDVYESAIRVATKYDSSIATIWYSRTPAYATTTNVFTVQTGGQPMEAYSQENYGIRPAIILPSNLAYKNGTIDGTEAVLKDVARKIKKAYIGIGGVARPCWSGGKLEYYGTITGGDLTRGSDKIGGTSNNKYAIFGGGTNSSYGNRLEVYGYNENLTKTVATNLSNCSTEASMCTGSNGKYGIFAGGYQYYRGDKFYNTIDAYDETLTKATATLSTNINRHSGTKVGNYSVHLGGKTSSAQESGLVTAIDKSLTVQYLTQVTTGGYSSRESTNKYAMFGRNGYSTLYAYDDQLTQTVHESPINGAFNDSAAATGNAVVFIEQYSYGYSGNIACDNNFTFSTIAKPERNYSNQMGCSFGDFAMFVGGVNWSGSQGYNTTDSYAYDSSLVLTQIGSLKYTRAYGAAKAVGNYAVVAGGIVDGADTGTTTEAYTIV